LWLDGCWDSLRSSPTHNLDDECVKAVGWVELAKPNVFVAGWMLGFASLIANLQSGWRMCKVAKRPNPISGIWPFAGFAAQKQRIREIP
jgi:hypothetical protein